MKTLNTLKISLLFVIMASMFASCSKDEIELVEDGNGPTIELRLESELDASTLSGSYDYSDHSLTLPLGELVHAKLNVKDLGGLSKVEVRTVKWEIIGAEFTTSDITPTTTAENQYNITTFENPISNQNIVELNAQGLWEISPAIPLYLVAFDRDLLITAIDRSGNISELRIKVRFDHDGELSITFD